MTIDFMDLALHTEVLIGVSVLSVLVWPRLSTLSSKSPPLKWMVVGSLCFAWLHGVFVSIITTIPAIDIICVVGIHVCANVYGASKFCVYSFFIERQYIITAKGPRRKNVMYIVSVLLLLPFVVIIVLLTLFHLNSLENGVCHIGVTREGTIPLVVYDCAFGLYQTSLFAFIMSRYISLKKPEDAQAAILRKSLKIVLIGSFVACALSFMNLFALTLHNTLPANLCYFLCFLDLLGNACVLIYVMCPVSAPKTLKKARMMEVVVPKVAERPPCAPANSVVEEYEQELQIVAEMLKQMQTQGIAPMVVSSTETTPLATPSSQCR